MLTKDKVTQCASHDLSADVHFGLVTSGQSVVSVTLCACDHVLFGQCHWVIMDFSVCYMLINIHTYTTSALFQVRVPVFPLSVVCCNTSALSGGCSPRIPRLLTVQQ